MASEDYSRPGRDRTVSLPAAEWQRGIVYTARPEISSPLRSGQEYRITAAFKKRIAEGNEFTGYAELYKRISRLINLRIAQLRCPEDESLFTWITRQGWGAFGEPYNFATAFLTIGLISLKAANPKLQGESVPTPESLRMPGGAIERAVEQNDHSRRADEIYNEFDLSDRSNEEIGPVMLSYGERVPNCEEVNFEHFVNKAEKFAEMYYDFLKQESCVGGAQFEVVGREWYTVTSPNLAVVHIYFLA